MAELKAKEEEPKCLNPLESGRVVKYLNNLGFKIRLLWGLNPLESGRVVK